MYPFSLYSLANLNAAHHLLWETFLMLFHSHALPFLTPNSDASSTLTLHISIIMHRDAVIIVFSLLDGKLQDSRMSAYLATPVSCTKMARKKKMCS